MATETSLMTAEDCLTLPETGRPTELVRGKLITSDPHYARHGQLCSRIALFLGRHLDCQDLGHLISNDSGVITQRDPDTVRGADVAFYSYHQVPKGPIPPGYLTVPPDIVFEVLSPSERRTMVLAKVAEYLEAGVKVVCVLDDQPRRADIYFADKPTETLQTNDELTLPEILGDFRVLVGRFFE